MEVRPEATIINISSESSRNYIHILLQHRDSVERANAMLINDIIFALCLPFRMCFVVMMKTRCIPTSFTEIQLLVRCFFFPFAFILIVTSICLF